MISENDRKLYIGDINEMKIKNVRRIDKEYIFTMKISTIKKNASFYEDITGRIISFDFDCEIVPKEIAQKFLEDAFDRAPEKVDQLRCYYTSYENLGKKETITKEEQKIFNKKIKFMRKYTS